MSDRRKSRFDNAETVIIEDGDSLLDAGKESTAKATKPIIDLSSLNTKGKKPLTSSYSSTERHEKMLKEMIKESGKDKSKFIRYMIETFYEMSRGQ